jgi:hypothetical protein
MVLRVACRKIVKENQPFGMSLTIGFTFQIENRAIDSCLRLIADEKFGGDAYGLWRE